LNHSWLFLIILSFLWLVLFTVVWLFLIIHDYSFTIFFLFWIIWLSQPWRLFTILNSVISAILFPQKNKLCYLVPTLPQRDELLLLFPQKDKRYSSHKRISHAAFLADFNETSRSEEMASTFSACLQGSIAFTWWQLAFLPVHAKVSVLHNPEDSLLSWIASYQPNSSHKRISSAISFQLFLKGMSYCCSSLKRISGALPTKG
jgi:hypothetical protein